MLVVLSGVVLLASKRSRAPWSDELTVLAVPVVVLVAMSIFTDINLGLRYILPIFPVCLHLGGKARPLGGAGYRAAGSRPPRGLIGGSLLGDDGGDGDDPSRLPGLFQLGLGRSGPQGRST